MLNVKRSMNAQKKAMFIASSAFLLSMATVACASGEEVTPLSLTHFDGMENWDVYSPGEIALDNDKLGHLRVAYDGVFASPNGPLVLASYIDVMDVMFNGAPSDWMQWTFTSEVEGESGAASLDLLIMDKETGALRFRLLPSGPGSTWGGPYNSIGVIDETSVKRILLADEDNPQKEEIPIDGPIFDFGGLPFVLPFMGLETGDTLMLEAYQQSGADGVQLLAVNAVGETIITDTAGNEHEVLEVQTLAPSKTTRVSFYVSDQPPYFYGWDYRKIDDGSSLFKMIYRGYISTEIGG